MVRPITLWPSARSMAATVEESTPPDMATAMVLVGSIQHSAVSTQPQIQGAQLIANRRLIVNRGEFSQAGYRLRYEVESEVDFVRRVLLAQAEADAGARAIGAQAHRGKHVRRFDCARGTRRARRNRQALEIERDDQR